MPKKTVKLLLVLALAVCMLTACDVSSLLGGGQATQICTTVTVYVTPSATVTPSPSSYVQQGLEGLVAPNGELLKVHFIDVYQGDAIFVEFPDGTNMLIDAGENSSVKTDMLLTYLNSALDQDVNGVLSDSEKVIDRLMLTHTDSDHVGGMDNVLDAYTINKIYMPKIGLPLEPENAGGTAKAAQLGTISTVVYKTFYEKAIAETAEGGGSAEIIFNVGIYSIANATAGYTMDVYCQSEEYYSNICNNSDGEDKNNMSPIAILSFGGRQVCLTGDASWTQGSANCIPAELNFMALAAERVNKDVDVLKAGHHGSDSSSGTDFLDFLKPEYVVTTNGDADNGSSSQTPDDDFNSGNTYDHPNAATVSRLYKAGVKALFRTDRHGNILLTVGTNGGMSFATTVNAACTY